MDNLWINGWDPLQHKMVALAATAVMFGEDQRLGLPPVFSTSTGTALRASSADAQTHALMELIERDSVAIWWYNFLSPARLSDKAAREAMPPGLAAWLETRKRRTWHLKLASDLGVCVIVTLSSRQDGSAPAIGAAAALNPVRALTASTLEMLQCEIALAHMRAAQKMPEPPPIPPLLRWSSSTDTRSEPHLAGCGDVSALPAETTLDAVMAQLRAKDIELYYADLTRPEFGVPVVKAVSPQLRDWLPRFGPGRLYDVPVELGLLSRPTPEAELNPVPFVI